MNTELLSNGERISLIIQRLEQQRIRISHLLMACKTVEELIEKEEDPSVKGLAIKNSSKWTADVLSVSAAFNYAYGFIVVMSFYIDESKLDTIEKDKTVQEAFLSAYSGLLHKMLLVDNTIDLLEAPIENFFSEGVMKA
jgi:hypothetical protein